MSEILGQGVFCLREIRVDDRDKIYRWRNSPAVAKYMFTDQQITEVEHCLWFDAALKNSNRKYWIIVYDKEEVGLVNIYNIDNLNKRCCYASYIVSEDLRGKGIGALTEYYILMYLFEDLGFNKVCAEVLAFNKAGINVHKSLGFQEEGFYRQHRIKNVQFVDVVALAMLRSEWNEKKPQIEKKLKAKGIL
jgi:UDP-4-amino-4,6-dideoxy-N-acetyl-beta-L-altrosamine N-acetyltransferase